MLSEHFSVVSDEIVRLVLFGFFLLHLVLRLLFPTLVSQIVIQLVLPVDNLYRSGIFIDSWLNEIVGIIVSNQIGEGQC